MGGYQGGYRVTGDIIGYGSDGEPILQNVKALDSAILPIKAITEMDKKRVNEIRAAYKNLESKTGVPAAIIDWLANR